MLEQITWQPGIGDPTIMGWVTVVAYFFASLCAYKVYRHLSTQVLSRAEQPMKLFWLLTAIALLCLCINKQLDVQTLFTQIGKALAREEGWYARRRQVQLYFIVAIAGLGSLLCVYLLWYFRNILRDVGLALIGLCFLVSFIVIRAASFHHIDYFLGSHFMGIKFNWLFELSGIFLIMANTLHLFKRTTRNSSTGTPRPFQPG